MRPIHSLFALATAAGVLLAAPLAHAEDAQAYIQGKHAELEKMLHQPASAARDEQVNHSLDAFVDYDELTRRAFGEPCHASLPNCEDIWAGYEAEKQKEVHDLLKQLVENSYRKNLLKTLDFDIAYRGTREQGGDTRVVTEAQDKSKPHDPPIRVDYVLKQGPGGWRVVDIVTEGSSLTKNYYDQFRKKMHNPGEGYPNIVAKLKEKIAKQAKP
jgi:phospholipid transport system substrate-binding protein